MKARDYIDTAGPDARKVDRPGWPQTRIDLTPAPGRCRCGAPTMILRYAQRSPKAPAPSRETARFQRQCVGVQEGTRSHAERTKAPKFLEQPASCLHFRRIPKLDVAGSTPVARSRESAVTRQGFFLRSARAGR